MSPAGSVAGDALGDPHALGLAMGKLQDLFGDEIVEQDNAAA